MTAARRRVQTRVYAWQTSVGFDQRDALGDEHWHRQAEAFVATTSQRKAAGLIGENPGALQNLHETGNVRVCRLALAHPERVMLRSINQGQGGPVIDYRTSEKVEG